MTPGFVELTPGTRLGGPDGMRYEVKRKLGEGGMGAVYLALDTVTASERALKLLHEGLFRDALALRDFAQEAKVTGPFEGEARDFVVEVFDAGVCPKTSLPFLAMEMLKGEELGARIDRLGSLNPDDVLTVVSQLAVVLDEAARRGIVHRDLKPENLFLTMVAGHPVLKVLDFGIAKLLRDGASGPSRAIGTPVYMAPEQFESQPLSPRTDLWALGLIVFTALTGMTFWRHADNVAKLIHEVLFSPRAAASERAREGGVELPAGFDAWFARCTHNDPLQRFETAAEAVAALTGLTGWVQRSERPAALGASEAHAATDAAVGTPKRTVALGTTPSPPLREGAARVPTTHPQAVPKRWKAVSLLALLLAAGAAAVAVWRWPDGARGAPALTFAQEVAQSNPWRAVGALRGAQMQAHEVTRAEFARSQGGTVTVGDPALPRGDVRWEEASEFCAAVGGRLPTADEWRAALSGSDWERRVRFPHALHTAGAMAEDRTGDGVSDLAGNVGEWVSDGAEGSAHAWMGALHTDAEPELVRGRMRESTLSGAGPRVGFRCVRVAP